MVMTILAQGGPGPKAVIGPENPLLGPGLQDA
jgi:hypothetical protein